MARNLITDVSGLRVGQAGDAKLGSGVTTIVFDAPVVASVDVRGGGPGTRETALLDPAQTVEGIDAIVLSGGSAFGLDCCFGRASLAARTRARFPGPRSARTNRARRDHVRPAVGRRQGLGSLSALPGTRLRSRTTVRCRTSRSAAPARARRHHRQPQGWHRFRSGEHAQRHHRRRNCGGQRRRQHDHRRWSAFLGGSLRARKRNLAAAAGPRKFSPEALAFRSKGASGENTTLAVVATDAKLTKAQANRLAVMAQSGLSRAIYPVHTPLDGDVVFAAAPARSNCPIRLCAQRTRHACGQRAGPRHRTRYL